MDRVKFIESSHRYVSDKGELISVSKFMDRFKEKVDWKEVARKKALKMTKEGNPTTQKELLDEWDRKRVVGTTTGTNYHNHREKQLLNLGECVFYNVNCKTSSCKYEGTEKISTSITEVENNTVYPELMIYDFEYMLCGQSDKTIIVNNTINIWDYKTDKEIKFKAYSDKWVAPKKLLSPVQHLDDVNGNHYALKMSLYMYMLWKANKGRFKPGEIIIEHVILERDADGVAITDAQGLPNVIEVIPIKLPYLKKEVINMLKTRRK